MASPQKLSKEKFNSAKRARETLQETSSMDSDERAEVRRKLREIREHNELIDHQVNKVMFKIQ